MLTRRFWLWGVLLGVSLALVAGLWLLGEAPRSTGTSDGVSLQEGVEVRRQGAEQTTPPGGERSTISDGLEFIIRDAQGRVKEEGRGQ